MADEVVEVAAVGAAGVTAWQPPLGAALLGTILNVKTTNGKIYGMRMVSQTNTDAYVQLFNAPAASVTLGTTDPVHIIKLPAPAISASAMYSQVNLSFTPPLSLGGTGISAAATTGPTNSTASTVFANVYYV